jgi:hypothetical protein
MKSKMFCSVEIFQEAVSSFPFFVEKDKKPNLALKTFLLVFCRAVQASLGCFHPAESGKIQPALTPPFLASRTSLKGNSRQLQLGLFRD